MVFEDGMVIRAWLQPDAMRMMRKVGAFRRLVPANPVE
jgi:hypothetical protein